MNKSKKLTLLESMKMLSEMTLLDRFLFSETMSDPEAYTAALQIILGQDELKLLTPPQAEKEVSGLELGDGAVRIFLNTRGKNDDEITPELKEFLRYVESTDGEFAEKSGSERIKKIHACVNRIKSSEEAGIKFMKTWIERIEFLEEGRKDTIKEMVQKIMQKHHMTEAEALDFLEIPEAEWENIGNGSINGTLSGNQSRWGVFYFREALRVSNCLNRTRCSF